MSFWKRLFGLPESPWELPFIQDICIVMIRMIPSHWDSVALVLEVTPNGIGSGLAHSAITPTPVKDFGITGPDFVMPDMSVFSATRELELAWVAHKVTFKRAIITAVRDAEGNWDVRSTYQD